LKDVSFLHSPNTLLTLF